MTGLDGSTKLDGMTATETPIQEAAPDTAKWVERVSALLRQAESTDHPAEAEAFTAKAQELIAKFAISEAQLAAAQGRKITEQIVIYHFRGHPKYKDGDWSLVRGIVHATGCKERTFLGHKGVGYSINVIGFESDVEAFKLLYASLDIQRARALGASKSEKPSWVNGNVWNREFFEGFAGPVCRRLRETTKAVQAEATDIETEAGIDQDSEQSFLPVLADKRSRIEEFEDQHFGKPKYGKSSSGYHRQTSHDARGAGRAAGEKANIGTASLRSTPGLGRAS